MPEKPLSRRAPIQAAFAAASINMNYKDRAPIMAPRHSWLTSPARSHSSFGQGTELPLHLIALIINHLDNVADLARVTRTSRVFYYMALPRLYEEVTLRSYADIRYVNGRPEGFGNGSPFAMGLNTLVSKTYTDYVRKFRVTGETREHDTEDYSKGRVPDNSMMLQIAMRAALDKMKNLMAFAWELNTKPLQTIYQGIMARPTLTSLTLRCQTKRIPRPTTLIPPLPNLVTLVIYDIDPLCYPDDFSLLLLTAKKLENLKLHWHPRMRESGEESVNLTNYFGRCLAAKHRIPVKRMAMYNLYARNTGEGFENCTDASTVQEMTIVNCMGSSSDPMNVFLDNTWRVSAKHPIHHNMKMLRVDIIEKEHAIMLARFCGLERFYLIDNKAKRSQSNSMAATPTTPSISTPAPSNNCTSANSTPLSEQECKSVAGDYLAVIQSNHRTMRHLLLPDRWQLNDDALLKVCQSCPNLEQLGFSCNIPPLDSLRHIFGLVPKLFALRILIRQGSELAEKLDSIDLEMHEFALSTELWHPQYRNLRFISMGDKYIYKLGGVVYPKKKAEIPPGQENSMNAKRQGPLRRLERVSVEEVQHVEIWGMDSTEFSPEFP